MYAIKMILTRHPLSHLVNISNSKYARFYKEGKGRIEHWREKLYRWVSSKFLLGVVQLKSSTMGLKITPEPGSQP